MGHPLLNVAGSRVEPIFVLRVQLLCSPLAEFGFVPVIRVTLMRFVYRATKNHVFQAAATTWSDKRFNRARFFKIRKKRLHIGVEQHLSRFFQG